MSRQGLSLVVAYYITLRKVRQWRNELMYVLTNMLCYDDLVIYVMLSTSNILLSAA